MYDLLNRMKLSVLAPRPRRRKSDPEAQRRWAERAALFVQQVREQHPDQQLAVWFQDEARVGRRGSLTRVWAERGSSPRAVRQSEYQWGYLFGAVNPLTGDRKSVV